MILMALADLDKGDGVPVKVVSKMLHVDPSFVTTQSKLLEKKGFMRRKSSQDDANVIALAMWRTSFGGVNDFGLGSAIAVLLFILVIPALALNIRRFRREV